jgi:hypothetical protein
LFWYHNSGRKDFNSRNPAWISGGIEKDGKIIWSQPEILLYEDKADQRMSYPDLIEQNGKYWITETNKENARCHPIPDGFFDLIWSQFDRKTVTVDNLVAQWNENEIRSHLTFQIPQVENIHYQSGFTFDFKISLTDLRQGQVIFVAKAQDSKEVVLQTGEYGSVEIVIRNGTEEEKWNSDPGLINAFGEHCVAVSVDNGPKIIQFVVDGTVCNGRDFRQYGWTRFKSDLEKISFEKIEIGDLNTGQLRPKGTLKNLRVYNQPLMNTEIIGNHLNSEL